MIDKKRKSFSDLISNKREPEIETVVHHKKDASASVKLITFQVSEAQWVALKMRSLEEKRSMKEIIIQAIETDYQAKGLSWSQ